MSQSEKFDPDGKFIRHYLPALAELPAKSVHAPWMASPMELVATGLELGRDYPAPIVRHDQARQRTLLRYAAARRSLD